MELTRKEKVLQVLETATCGAGGMSLSDGTGFRFDQGWVNGHDLCHPAIGGSEGLRRLRELRAEGHEIEMRPHPVHGRTSRQYRLVRPERLF